MRRTELGTVAIACLTLTLSLQNACSSGDDADTGASATRRVRWGTELLEVKNGLIYVKGEDAPYTGITFEEHDNGNLKSEFNYVDGRLEGPAIKYYESGSRKSMATHVNGHVDGVVTDWWENGNKRREQTIKQGRVHGRVTQWHEDGELFQTYQVTPQVVQDDLMSE